MSHIRKQNLLILLILVLLSACAGPQKKEDADLILGPRNRSFVIDFGEGVDREAIEASAQINPDIPITLRWRKESLIVIFDENLTPAERLEFSVDEAAISASAEGGNKHIWAIETEPYAVTFEAKREDKVKREYYVEFNYPVDAASIEKAIRIEPDFEPEFEWNEDFTSVSLIPTALIPASNYSISIPPYAFTLGSPPEQAFTWDFISPTFEVDFNQRVVDEEIQNTRFKFNFNYPLSHEVFDHLLTISPALDYRNVWNSDFSELTLTTNKPLSSDTQYTFEVALTPIEGSDIDWLTSKWVSYYSSQFVDVKVQRQEAQTRTPAIEFEFNYPMNQPSVEQALETSPSFAYDLTWNQYGTRATMQALEGLEPGREYKVTLKSAFDLEGNPLHIPGRSDFTMNAIIVDRNYPSAWDRDEPWSITFGYPMDPESFAEQAYAEPAFEYALSWNYNNTQVVIEPLEPLLGNQDYAIRFTEPLIDAAGYPLGEFSYLQFTNPSPIVGLLPDPYRAFRADQDVVIDFDRALDSLHAVDAISIDPAVDVSYVWQDEDLALSPPAEGWDPGQQYTITLDPSVRDNSGREVILEPVETTFYVSSPTRFISFGAYGSDVQVVDTEGTRKIQVASSSTDIEAVQIDLHRISVEQYLEFIKVPNINDQLSYTRFRYQPDYDLSSAASVGSWQLPVNYLLEPDYYNPVAEIELPGEINSGLYVASLVHEDFIRDQLLINFSSASVVVKDSPVLQGGGQISVWVNNLNDFVMPQTRISVFDFEGRVISSGITNEIGMFESSYAEDSEPYLVVARRADEISISGVTGSWRSGDPYQSTRISNKYFAYIYTDRPIYQPGHIVNFKGILRLDNDAHYQVPPKGMPLTLTVFDPRKNVIENRALNANQYGSVAGEIALQDDIMLGNYSIELAIGETTFKQSFLVQEYEKPDFTIEVASDKDTYIVGEQITLDIDTEYLFGEPVPNAQLEVKWYELSHYFSSYSYDWIYAHKNQTLQTDELGHATLEILAPYKDVSSYYRPGSNMRWGVEVSADDGSNQFNSGSTNFRVYRQLYVPNIRTESYWHQSDAPVNIEVSLTTPFDEPLGAQELTVIIERNGGASNGWEYEELEKLNVSTDEDGTARIEYEPSLNGRYRLVVSGVDRIGHVYDDISWFTVYNQERPWYRETQQSLWLTTAEDEYAVGDMAQLIIESSFDGEALLTLERGTVHEERLIQLSSPITFVDVPITGDFAPNIYAVVQAWQPNEFSWDNLPEYYYSPNSQPDGKFVSSSAFIDVPDTQHKLQIEITAEKDSYRPREEAKFEIQVLDHEGQPVQAELSLALVDEAIFLLRDERSEEIHSAFFSDRKLGVYTYDSMSPERDLVLGDYSGDRGGGPDADLIGDPRSDFPDTAIWLPNVETDEEGKATLTVTLPDSLTSWRLTAKAVSLNTEVGETISNIITQQAAVLRPLPPNNLIEGDTFTFSTIVHNFSDEDAEFNVSINSPELGLGIQNDQNIMLKAGELQVVAWQSQAQAAGEAEVTIAVESAVGNDAIRMTIQVEPLALEIVSTDVGIFSGNLQLPMIIDANAHEISTLDIEISNSIAGSLLSGVEYLTGYPYGCVEQVMSRALPNAVVGRAFDQLGYAERAASVDLDDKTAQSIQRLYALQHSDGGWGWWYDDSSDEYQTAWVIFGLATTGQAGYQVDESVILRGTDWLSRNMFKMDPATRAFALYSMAVAGEGDLRDTQLLAENPDRLDTFALASLAITLNILGDEEGAESILDELITQVNRLDETSVSWGEEHQDGYYRSKTMASQVRTTAIVLSALLQLDPENELIPDAANWLMSQRRNRGWGTTNETAFTILALTDYVLFNKEAGKDAKFQVFVDNDRSIAQDQFNANTMSFSYSIPLSELDSGQNELRVETEQDASLYYVVSKNLFVEETTIAADGIPVTRSFLDPKTRKPLFEIEEGQLILVRLEIEMPQDGWYILLEDYLPGGIEAINERLNSTSYDVRSDSRNSSYLYAYESLPQFFWQDYGYNFKEIRGNRVSFFITNIYEGTRVIEYYARAITPGVFAVMPTQLSAMYNPEIWGYSDSNALEIFAATP